MGMALFSITDKNPNDYGGSGGCMCSPIKTSQCRPPYCAFLGSEMLAPRSPIPVLSLHCAQQFVAKCAALEAARPVPPQEDVEPALADPAAGAKAEAELVTQAKARSTRRTAL